MGEDWPRCHVSSITNLERMSLKRYKKSKRKHRSEKDQFYHSREWKELRYEKLKETRYCECCGKTTKDRLESGQRVKLTVDHIKPRSEYPELRYEYDNLQVLCQDCNQGKDIDVADFRGDFEDEEVVISIYEEVLLEPLFT